MNPSGHDFNWVKARRNCVSAEWIQFKESLEKSVRDIQEDFPRENRRCGRLSFKEETPDALVVTRSRDYAKHMILISRDGPEIRFRLAGEIGPAKDLFVAVLVLNETGHCRYKVGDIEFLRWQVIRRALEQFAYS